MTLENLLETFDPLKARITNSNPTVLEPSEIEQIRTQTFEAGYTSGWEDAKASDNEARHRVEAEFERNIQNLAFTYNEAVDRVRGELKMFVAALIEGFFPDIIPDLLREHVRAELIRIADDFVEVPLEIVTSPDCAQLVEEMLQSDFAMKIELVTDPNLADRQVFIRIAERELEVDLSPLLAALREQFEAIQQQSLDGKLISDAG